MTEEERELRRQILMMRIDTLYPLKHDRNSPRVKKLIEEWEREYVNIGRKPDQSKRARNVAQEIFK